MISNRNTLILVIHMILLGYLNLVVGDSSDIEVSESKTNIDTNNFFHSTNCVQREFVPDMTCNPSFDSASNQDESDLNIELVEVYSSPCSEGNIFSHSSCSMTVSHHHQYVLLDQKFNHEEKFKRSTEHEVVYEEKPITDIVFNFLWEKVKPIAHSFTSSISKRVDMVAKSCQLNCHCARTAIVTQNWLTGNKRSNPPQCKAGHKEYTSLSTSTYDNFLSSFLSGTKKLKQFEMSINIPLMPMVDVSGYDKSISNVDIEDQIFFHIIQNAIGFAVGKFLESLEKHFSVPEVHRLDMEKYVDVVKRTSLSKEDRVKYRRERMQLS